MPKHGRMQKRKKINIRKDGKKEKESRVSESSNFIENLSDDCLIEIFQYLSLKQRLRIEQVCTRWRDLFKNFWHDVKKIDFLQNSPFDIVKDFKKQAGVEQLLIRCGRYLSELSLSSVCDSTIMPYVGKHCFNLKKLMLELNDYTDKHFVNAFSIMENLKYIKIKQTYGVMRCLQSLPDEIEEIHLDNFFRSQKSQPRLKLHSLTKFNRLRSLSLHFYVLDKKEVTIISQKTTLTHLDLMYCKASKQDLSFIPNLVNLTKLNLREILTTTDSLLIDLASKCKDLRCLDVSCCIGVTDYGAKSVLKNFPNLERFNLSGTSVTVESILCAVEVTKYRQNGIVLTLIADSWVLPRSDGRGNVSPFLEVVRWW